jgi:hypothetical protein
MSMLDLQSNFKRKSLSLSFLGAFAVFAGCMDEKDSFYEIELKMSCRQASQFVGGKVDDFPVNSFSDVRLTHVGAPITMDRIETRTTVVFSDDETIVSAYCG